MKRSTIPFLAALISCASPNFAAEPPTSTASWTLRQTVDYAGDHSSDTRLAQLRIENARAELNRAKSGYQPSVTIGGSASATDNPMMAFGSILNQGLFNNSIDFNHPGQVNDLNLNAEVAMPLYTGGQLSGQKRAAAANLKSSIHQADAVRNQLEFETVHAYFSVVQAGRFRAIAQAEEKALASSLAVARKRVKAGTALDTEALALEVKLAEVQEQSLKAGNSEQLALRALTNLVGSDNPITAVDPTAATTSLLSGENAPSPVERPELMAAQSRVQAAKASFERARAGYKPQVQAFARFDHDEGWHPYGAGDSWQAGIRFKLNIWNGFRTRAETRAARTQVSTATEQQRKLSRGLELQLESARLNLIDAGKRVGVLKKAVGLATDRAVKARKQFQQGVILSNQLTDAETALTETELRLTVAEIDRRMAEAALLHASGQPIFK